jgi:hypothetical protein
MSGIDLETEVSQAADIDLLGIYKLLFAADIGRLGAKGLNKFGKRKVFSKWPQILMKYGT